MTTRTGGRRVRSFAAWSYYQCWSLRSALRSPRVTALMAVSLLAGLVVAAAPAASAATGSSRQRAPATARSVVRPVNVRGRAARGFAVRTVHRGYVICSDGQQSLVAVDGNIAQCFPNSMYPAACWKAARPHRVLCFDNARNTWVRSIRLRGRFAPSRPLRRPIPLKIRLGTGTYCSIRIGGAGPQLRGHPRFYVAYYCTRGMAIWARIPGHPRGINRTRRAWTVHVAPSSGRNPHLRRRRVARAWFVGTRRSPA